ncbi:MAG TPA: hypothetical protein VK885_11610 [Desulfotignum sp.]|nr:hypothetical protein [Desulfotignum sp.]
MPVIRLSPRETVVIAAGGLLVLVFAAVQFFYLPLVDKKQDLARILAVEQDAIRQIADLQNQYLDLARDMETGQTQVAGRPRDFTLFSFLDGRAEKTGIKQNIEYMRPFSQDLDDGPYLVSKVRVKLNNLVLDDFIDFLQSVETSGNGVQVTSLSLSRIGDPEALLEAVLEAQTLMPKEPG